MTLRLGANLIETDDSVPVRPSHIPGMVTVRIKNGQNWHGNTFTDCDLHVPAELVKDASGKA